MSNTEPNRSRGLSVAEMTGPSFANPPVVETALSIQFEELGAFNTTHFGLYYPRVKDRYPDVQDQPRLAPIVERFPGPRWLGPPSVRVQELSFPQRVWFVHKNKSELIQVQADRFVFNWRLPQEGGEYPRYRPNEAKCIQEFETFCEFCRDHELGEVSPNLAEVVYVNHITPVGGESASELFGQVFSGLRWEHSDSFLPSAPGSARFDRVYEISGQRGRLYAEASIGRSQSGGELVQLKVTARVVHERHDQATIRDTLRLAHDWVVNGFVSMTDPKLQRERWGKRP